MIIYSLLPERIINLVLGGFGSIILIYGASIDFISIDGNYSKLWKLLSDYVSNAPLAREWNTSDSLS